jgi:membrane protease YdiL (CAAX protease family)
VSWGVPLALLPWGVFVVLVGLQFGIGFVLRNAGVRLPREPIVFAVELGAYLVLAATVVLVVRRGRGGLVRDLGLAIRPVDLALGLGGFAVVWVARLILGAIAIGIVGVPSHSNLFLEPDPLWFALTNVLVACVIAPLVEESMARGLVLRAARSSVLRRGIARGLPDDDRRLQVRAAWIAVLVSSAVFTLGHLWEGYDDPRVMVLLIVTTLPMALVAGAFAIRTGRLGAGIVMHALLNLSATVLAYAQAHG